MIIFNPSTQDSETYLSWRKHIKKVASTHLSNGSDKSLRVSSLDPPFGNASQLSLSAEHFHSGLKIPLAFVQGIWQKAEELLCEPNAISAAPACDSKNRMVRSRSGKRPHLVTSNKQGRYTCDNDCPNWKSMKLFPYCGSCWIKRLTARVLWTLPEGETCTKHVTTCSY